MAPPRTLSRQFFPRAILAAPAFLAFAVGCQSADLAKTNIASLSGPIVPQPTGQFVMTTDTVAGIRDALVKVTAAVGGIGVTRILGPA